jgi:hypothetical protein
MPFLMLVLALLAPRVVVVALWFLSTWFAGMFDSILWPILGVIFLPTTLLWYSAVQHWFAGAWSLWPVVGLVIALLFDLSPARGAARRRP